jgi:hypothetical protein
MVDLDPDDLDSAFHALVGMLSQFSDPIVMTNDHVEIFEAPPGTAANLTFKYLGPGSAEFADQGGFRHLDEREPAPKSFPVPDGFRCRRAGPDQGRECFLLVDEGSLDTTAWQSDFTVRGASQDAVG